MTKTNMDMMVGATILISVVILIGGVLWLKNVTVTRKLVSYSVLFPNVGTLSTGDPVNANGVRHGIVHSIKLQGSAVVVQINVDRSLRLTDSCRITVSNIGIMGERLVAIQLSEKGTLIKPNGSDPTRNTPIQGYFESGIAEAMGQIGTVLADVESLVTTLHSVVRSTVADTGFISSFHSIVLRLDKSLEQIDLLLAQNRGNITESVRTVRIITADVKTLLDKNKDNISTIFTEGAILATEATALTGKLDSLLGSAQSLLASIDRGEGAAGMLIRDEQFKKELRTTMSDLDSLLQVSRVQGLPVKLRLFGSPKK